MSIKTIRQLAKEQLLRGVPSFLPESIHYSVIMGSNAYGVSSDTSDIDVYAMCIPDKNLIFPHLRGFVHGFDNDPGIFTTYEAMHVVDPSVRLYSDEANSKIRGREYDIVVHSITKYFKLCMGCNPNMIDSLFVPERCVIEQTPIGTRLRESRKEFLTKRCWHTYKGYAYEQLRAIKTKQPSGKRKAIVDQFGYDVKFAYHIVRLLNQVEQILVEGDLDLERSREQLKSIRAGEWTLDQIEDYFGRKQSQLEQIYSDSKLPSSPNIDKIKSIMLDCIEQHFGTIKDCIVAENSSVKALREIKQIVDSLDLGVRKGGLWEVITRIF